MRKVSSAPNLSALVDTAAPKRLVAGAQVTSSMASCPAPASKPFLGRRTVQANTPKVPGLHTSSDRSSQASKAFAAFDHPPYIPDPGTFQFVETVLAEASSKGVLGAECFLALGAELSDAPPLMGNINLVAGSQQEVAMRDLAACLAEPQVVEERGVMETVQNRMNQVAARNNIEVQLRYVEATRLAEDGQEQEQEDRQGGRRRALLREARLRRKRSLELEDLDDQLLLELMARSPSKPRYKPEEGEPPSAELLQVAFASMDESSNTLQLEDKHMSARTPAADTAFITCDPDGPALDMAVAAYA